jgi:hypothetical protein
MIWFISYLWNEYSINSRWVLSSCWLSIFCVSLPTMSRNLRKNACRLAGATRGYKYRREWWQVRVCSVVFWFWPHIKKEIRIAKIWLIGRKCLDILPSRWQKMYLLEVQRWRGFGFWGRSFLDFHVSPESWAYGSSLLKLKAVSTLYFRALTLERILRASLGDNCAMRTYVHHYLIFHMRCSDIAAGW